MKKLLLILGAIGVTACVLCLLYAALNLFGYYHVLDGSAELYRNLHQRAIVFFVIGAVLGAAGAGCLIARIIHQK